MAWNSQSTENPSTQIGTQTTTLTTLSSKLYIIHTLIYKAKQVCSTPGFLAKEMDQLHKILQDNHYSVQFFQQATPQQKMTASQTHPQSFIEWTRGVVPLMKSISGQYRCTLAKYKVRVFFKRTGTIKIFLMHQKNSIPDAQKTDIIYHWKCPAHNYTAEYIGETYRSLKEGVSDNKNQTTSAIKNHHISTNTQKQSIKISQ